MYTVYSKGESCPYCVKAKTLLKQKGLKFKVVLIPQDLTKDKLQDIVNMWVKPEDLTVPQIFLEGEIGSRVYIGGHDNLVEFLNKRETREEIDFSDMEI